jgi:hypothetical protein
MEVNGELERMRKEAAITYHVLNGLFVEGLKKLTVISWHESLIRVQLFLLKLFGFP